MCLQRPRRRAADERDELAAPHVEPPPPESVHRILSLPWERLRVLQTGLNCSERMRLLPVRFIPQLGVPARYTPFGGPMSVLGQSLQIDTSASCPQCPLSIR